MRALIVTAVSAESDAVVRGIREAGAFEGVERSLPGAPRYTRHRLALPMPRAADALTLDALTADVIAAGVGPAASAAATGSALATAIAEGAPYDLVISAGIGGGFLTHQAASGTSASPAGSSPAVPAAEVPAAGASVGLATVVVADAIVAADLGADTPEGFAAVTELGFGTVEHVPPPHLVQTLAEAMGAVCGTVLTVSTVTGTAARAAQLLTRHPRAVAEAMEGFGVAEAATAYGVPALEVRAVSNAVGPRDRPAWRIGEALDALAEAFAALARTPPYRAEARAARDAPATPDVPAVPAAGPRTPAERGPRSHSPREEDPVTSEGFDGTKRFEGTERSARFARFARFEHSHRSEGGQRGDDGPLRIAYSPCPNDTFVFDAWAHGRVPDAPALDVTFADIDITNGMAERGEFDVLKVSYAVLPWVLDQYALLPCGGALGRGCGPLVLTGGPARAADLAGRTVAVPSERSTAYLLFRLWAAAEVPGGVGEIKVLPFHEIMPAVRDGSVDAGLVIHEARFTYQNYGLHCLADMGEHWEATTGLPIPLGAIIAKRALGPERLRALAAAARTSVRMAWDDPLAARPYVLAHAQEMDPAVADQHIGLYVNEFTADLGEDGYAAVRGLLTRAAADGLVPALPPGALDFV